MLSEPLSLQLGKLRAAGKKVRGHNPNMGFCTGQGTDEDPVELFMLFIRTSTDPTATGIAYDR